MKDTRYIRSESGKLLYEEEAKSLPIVDYHCHLSPQEIYEDKVFDNIGQIWLGGDHYKWRLMRSYGVDESYITGNASWEDKFLKYIETLEYSPGSPLYHWSSMELEMFFDCDLALTKENAPLIWEKANKRIHDKQLSPRKLIAMSNTAYIGTTDDITDDLSYHELLDKDASFDTLVKPTFRTDNLLLLYNVQYPEYIEKLSNASKINITNLQSMLEAVEKRLDYFVSFDCRLSDIGIQYSADPNFSVKTAEKVFMQALNNEPIIHSEYEQFLGYMFVFLSGIYKKRNIVQQIHLGVQRNVNTRMFASVGADSGYDISSNALDAVRFSKLLDKMDEFDNLASSIVYILNPSSYYQALTICGSFKDVLFGAAWWHMDHYDGIEQNIKTTAALSSLGSSLGMLTDSRSFLSYARHDYYRRILCSIIGEWVDTGEYQMQSARKLVRKLSSENAYNRFVVKK